MFQDMDGHLQDFKIKNIMDDDAFSDRENLLKSKLIFVLVPSLKLFNSFSESTLSKTIIIQSLLHTHH